jgi:hypothetical protein
VASFSPLCKLAVEQSRADVPQALNSGDRSGRVDLANRRFPIPGWLLCRIIEEDARHKGHACLLHGSVGGATGGNR